jgi:hypothetical protein
MVPPTQCFLSYAHHDHQGFDRLLANLKPYAHLYGIKLWHDRGITAGSYWDAKIKAEIARSQIFVLLTSNDFLGSEYVLKHELPAIIDQHKTANALVVPVIYRTCGWQGFFGNYIQCVPVTPRGRLRPVRQWPDWDEAMALATDAIASAIRDWFGLPSPPSPMAHHTATTP